jgi:hypothetical protein
MAPLALRRSDTLEKIEQLMADIHALVRLEEESQNVLKLPVEQMLDSAGSSLGRLEERKTALMRLVDRHATEYFECRTRFGSEPTGKDGACAAAHQRLLQAFRSLQRAHQDNERVLQLRMTLLGEDMRTNERSRQFLRSTLQAVAA